MQANDKIALPRVVYYEHLEYRQWNYIRRLYGLEGVRIDTTKLRIEESFAPAFNGVRSYLRKCWILYCGDNQLVLHFKRGKVEGLKNLLIYLKETQ